MTMREWIAEGRRWVWCSIIFGFAMCALGIAGTAQGGHDSWDSITAMLGGALLGSGLMLAAWIRRDARRLNRAKEAA